METVNESARHILQFFKYDHLSPILQKVSKPFCELAYSVAKGPDNDQTKVCLQNLLDAKNAAVCAWIAEE